MQKFYPLKNLEKVKGKHKVDTCSLYGDEVWIGELDGGEYHFVIACINKIIKVKVVETEYELLYRRAINIAKINSAYANLGYLTEPPKNCEIKLVLNLLEWKYDDDEIWC